MIQSRTEQLELKTGKTEMTRTRWLHFASELENEEYVQGLFFLSISPIFTNEYGGKVFPPLLHCHQRASIPTHRVKMYFTYQTYLTMYSIFP